jgi:hypothetical protein
MIYNFVFCRRQFTFKEIIVNGKYSKKIVSLISLQNNEIVQI